MIPPRDLNELMSSTVNAELNYGVLYLFIFHEKTLLEGEFHKNLLTLQLETQDLSTPAKRTG